MENYYSTLNGQPAPHTHTQTSSQHEVQTGRRHDNFRKRSQMPPAEEVRQADIRVENQSRGMQLRLSLARG